MNQLRCTRCNYRGPAGSFVAGQVYGEPARCRFCRATAIPVQSHVVMASGNAASAASHAQGSPADVQIAKDQLNPYIVQMTTALSTQKVPSSLVAAWETWANNWHNFYGSESTPQSAPSDMDRLHGFRAELASFERQLLRLCPRAGIVSVTGADLSTTVQQGISTAGKVAIAGVVVGGALLAWWIYRATRTAEVVLPKAFEAAPKVAATNVQMAESAAKLLPAAL